MPKVILVILLMLSRVVPAQAELLTGGNLIADSLDGCLLGMGVGLASHALLSVEIPGLGIAIPQVSAYGSCLAGTAVAITLNGIAYFVDLATDFLNPNRPLSITTDMVYPETPGH
ncbi:conserved hypothetical protein [Gammaproteobacteria bacterium]